MGLAKEEWVGESSATYLVLRCKKPLFATQIVLSATYIVPNGHFFFFALGISLGVSVI